MSTAKQNPVTRRSAIIGFSLGTLFFGYAFLQRVAPSVMTNELMRDFAVGGAALGSLSAFYFYAYASIQLPVGMLTDHYGARKLMSFAAGLCALASLSFALSDSLITASIGRGFIGATVAFAFVGTLAIAGHWFKPAQYAMLAGTLQTVGMCGAIFGQAPLRYIVEAVGWRGMMGILAVFVLILSVLLFILVPHRSQTQRKVESGIGVLKGARLAASNPQTWLCALIGFGLASILLGFGALWAVPWLSTVHGYTTTEAAGIASVLFMGWAIFSPLMGWLSDRMGRRNPIMLCGAIICLIAFAATIFIAPTNTAILITLIFITGIGGCTMAICFSSVKEHNSLQCSSTALSVMNMCVVGSGAVMQPLIGWLLDLNWAGTIIDGVRIYSTDTYTIALSSLLVSTTGAIIGSLLLRETWCKQVG